MSGNRPIFRRFFASILFAMVFTGLLAAQEPGVRVGDGDKELTLDLVLKQAAKLNPRGLTGLQ